MAYLGDRRSRNNDALQQITNALRKQRPDN